MLFRVEIQLVFPCSSLELLLLSSYWQDSVDGRADDISMADEAFKDEAEVQSHFAAVKEVGDYGPGNRSSADDENCSDPGSYSESSKPLRIKQ